MSKKMYILGCMCGILFALNGCGGKEPEEPESWSASGLANGEPVSDGESALMEETACGDVVQDSGQKDKMRIPVNTEELDIRMEKPEMRFTAGSCAADGERIYFSQGSDYGNPVIYAMETGQDNVEELPISIPEGMDVNSLAVDVYGNLYVQLSTDRKHRAEGAEVRHLIWELDEKYQVRKEMDITDEDIGEYPPFYFLVDRDGRIYLQWGWYHIRAWILDENGHREKVITEESLGMDKVDLAGLDADGRIRMVCWQNGEAVIVRLDMQDGKLQEEQKAGFLKDGAICLALGAGTDSDMLLYDGSEIWALDSAAETAEYRNTYSESGEGFTVNVLQRIFLPDGRLFLLQTVTEEGELDAYRFRYVPGGR